MLKHRGDSVGLTTVYRTLQSLADAGEVDVLRTTDGESVYRRCSTGDHHHHLVCRVCGKAVEVEGPAVEQWAETIAAQHGFVNVAHTVEVFGTCAECAEAGRRGTEKRARAPRTGPLRTVRRARRSVGVRRRCRRRVSPAAPGGRLGAGTGLLASPASAARGAWSSCGQPSAPRSGQRAAEAAVALGVLQAGPPQVATVEVRPQHVLEDHLGVSALPDQVVGGALLTAGAQEEVHVRHVRVVQVLGEGLLVDLGRVELPGRHVRGDAPARRRRSRHGRRS